VEFPDQRCQHAIGNVGHQPDVVAPEGLQHHLVPGLLVPGLLVRSLLVRCPLMQALGRRWSLGRRHRILPCLATPLVRAMSAGGLVEAPKLDAIAGIVNMPDCQRALRRTAMPPAARHTIESVSESASIKQQTGISGTGGPPKMSVNNKRVFYVKYLAHEIYADILRARPDVRLDRLENESAEEIAAPILAAAHAYQIGAARDELARRFHADRDLLARAPNLLIVSSNGAGYDPVDVEACTAAGVLVVNQSGGNANSVAEHALGIKTHGDAVMLRVGVIAMMEVASVEADRGRRRRCLPSWSWVVVSPVTVGALNDLVRESLPHYGRVDPRELRVVLIGGKATCVILSSGGHLWAKPPFLRTWKLLISSRAADSDGDAGAFGSASSFVNEAPISTRRVPP